MPNLNQPILDDLCATLRRLTPLQQAWLCGWIDASWEAVDANVSEYLQGYRRGEADAKKGAADDAAQSG